MERMSVPVTAVDPAAAQLSGGEFTKEKIRLLEFPGVEFHGVGPQQHTEKVRKEVEKHRYFDVNRSIFMQKLSD